MSCYAPVKLTLAEHRQNFRWSNRFWTRYATIVKQENCLSSQHHRADAWRAARWRWRDCSWTLRQKHLHHNIRRRSIAECQCGLNADVWRSLSGFKTAGHERTLVSSCRVISFSWVLTGGLAPPAVRLHHPLKLTCGWNHMKLVFHW